MSVEQERQNSEVLTPGTEDPGSDTTWGPDVEANHRRWSGPRTGNLQGNWQGGWVEAEMCVRTQEQVELVERTKWRLDPARLQSEAGSDVVL